MAPQEWFHRLKELGYEGFITASHTPWSGPNPDCNLAFRRALNAGLWIGAYGRPVSRVTEALDTIAPEVRAQLKFFELDVEPEEDGVHPVKRWYVDGVKARGLRPMIYSGRGMWGDVMGDSTAFSDVPLWEFAADIEGWPKSITEAPINRFGGWNVPGNYRKGWQIRMLGELTVIDGYPVDENVFDRQWIEETRTYTADEALTLAGFTDPAKRRLAKAIGYGESSGYTDAVGDLTLVNEKYGPSIGWFQVRSLRDPMAWSVTDRWRIASALRDPLYNAKAAFAISKGGTDWTPWSVYKNSTYVQFLGLDYELRTGHPRAAEWSK